MRTPLPRARGFAVAASAALMALNAAGCDLGAPAAPITDAPEDASVVAVAHDMTNAPTPDLSSRIAPGDLAMPPGVPASFDDPQLAARQLNYGMALRTASLKLVGDLPTSDEIQSLATAPDPAAYYAQRVDAYLADTRFSDQIIAYFRNTFRSGGTPAGLPSLETAATFAARLVVEDRPFTDVVTASTATCPTYSNGQFADGNCSNGVPTASGVLTDPGIQALFVSNLAFRRARWVQETFACSKFPAEYRPTPVMIGGSQYTSPWPFMSIAGGPTAPVDFLASDTLICANCHSTINHLAPLFGNFDTNGAWKNSIQVTTPVNGLPTTVPTDWLPAGETTAWRFGQPVADIPDLGRKIIADPVFASCAVTRVYDWVMSKDDVVDDSATVPDDVIGVYRDAFVNGQFHLKAVIRQAFVSDDFVRF